MIVTQTCQCCGRVFKFEVKAGPRRKYCSVKCNNEASNRKRSKAVKEGIQARSCAWCGKEFKPRADNRRYRFCSNQCRILEVRYRNKYGVSPAMHDLLYVEQDGCCAICGKHQSELDKALHLDHCHKTGTVRGLLCATCNLGIGQFQDDPEIIESAIAFLVRSV